VVADTNSSTTAVGKTTAWQAMDLPHVDILAPTTPSSDTFLLDSGQSLPRLLCGTRTMRLGLVIEGGDLRRWGARLACAIAVVRATSWYFLKLTSEMEGSKHLSPALGERRRGEASMARLQEQEEEDYCRSMVQRQQ
jgi:hypothetical protein